MSAAVPALLELSEYYAERHGWQGAVRCVPNQFESQLWLAHVADELHLGEGSWRRRYRQQWRIERGSARLGCPRILGRATAGSCTRIQCGVRCEYSHNPQ